MASLTEIAASISDAEVEILQQAVVHFFGIPLRMPIQQMAIFQCSPITKDFTT